MSDLALRTNVQYDALYKATGEREVLVISHHKGAAYGGNFSVRAVPPTRRDIWAIVRGRYQPKIVVRVGITTAMYNRILKGYWKVSVEKELHRKAPLLDALREKGPGTYTLEVRK